MPLDVARQGRQNHARNGQDEAVVARPTCTTVVEDREAPAILVAQPARRSRHLGGGVRSRHLDRWGDVRCARAEPESGAPALRRRVDACKLAVAVVGGLQPNCIQ
ncbi:MAG: hypothetical protein ACXWX1_11900, partial [Aeromicrobium sp.]